MMAANSTGGIYAAAANDHWKRRSFTGCAQNNPQCLQTASVCGFLGTLNCALKGNSRRLTAADAQRCNTPLFVLVLHGVGQSHDKAAAGRAYRVALGASAAVHVDPCWVQTELLGSQHGDHGKRLIYFEQVH